MRQILVASLKGHVRRFVSGMLAIVLGVAFVGATLVALDSIKAALDRAVAAPYVRADLVVSNSTDKLVAQARKVEGVAAVFDTNTAFPRITLPDGSTLQESVEGVPADPGLRWQQVASGHLPTAAGEIAVADGLAKDKKLKVGSSLRLKSYDRSVPGRTMTVVGVLEPGSISDARVMVSEATAQSLGAGGGGDLLVRLTSGANASTVAQAIARATHARVAIGSDALVATPDSGGKNGDVPQIRTGAEATTQATTALSGGVDVIGGLLLGFTGIAMFVAMLVVANTFTIVIAQRARELALFRCVGAGTSQVFRSVLVEAIIVGLAASVVGVVAAVAVAQLALSLLGSYLSQAIVVDSLTIRPTALAIPVLVGVLTTLVAALLPARRATRVPPLAALRPEAAITVRSRAGIVRLVFGALLLVVGAGLVGLGMTGAGGPIGVLVGVAGGVVSFAGVLLFAPILAPALVRLLGLIARVAGVPGRVSADNAVRNPRRTAATATALLIGVTLISLLIVGAGTSQATADATLDQTYPVDLSVEAGHSDSGAQNALPAGTIQALGALNGITRVTPLRSARVPLGTNGEQTDVDAVEPAAASKTLHNPRPIEGLVPGTVILSPTQASMSHVTAGQKVTVGKGAQALALTVRVVKFEGTPDVIMTVSDLARVAPRSTVVGAWLRVSPDADMQKLQTDVQAATKQIPDVQIAGAAPIRAIYAQVIDAMLLVATGLLAMSVAIALVGVGNTLSLSVLERTRENALLRALGMTRGQLRGTLAVEALLIAGAAVVLGIVLGIVYGYAGSRALFAGVGSGDVTLMVPWGRIGLVALVSLGAGVLASVLPARRAAKVPPPVALASE